MTDGVPPEPSPSDVVIRYRIPGADDQYALEDRLRSRGYKFEEDFRFDNTYFQGTGLCPGDELCLGHEQGGADDAIDILTWVGRASDKADRVETRRISTAVEPQIHDILASLGFAVDIRITVFRRQYRREDVLAYVDSVEGLGSFLEFQLIQSEPRTTEARERLAQQARKLGLADEDVVHERYVILARRRRGSSA